MDEIKQLQRENRKMQRKIAHLKNAIVQEKLASPTILNQQKVSTYIQRERDRYLALVLGHTMAEVLSPISRKDRRENCCNATSMSFWRHCILT